MKLSQVRYFSDAFVILVCCCSAMAFGTATTATPDSAGWVQLSPGNSPPPRSYLAMTYDPGSGKVIVFGGFDGSGYLDDTWTFDGISWTQVATSPSPPARTNAQMGYDSVTQKVVLFGGYNGTNYLGDTWLWDGTTSRWTQARTIHRPAPVTGPMLFPDPNGHVDLLGGFDGRFYQYSMWQRNGSDWTQLFPAMLPYARSSAAVAANSSAGTVVLFGGLADVNPVNTWTYDGTTWTLKSTPTQPLWVYAGSASFDPNINAVILFHMGMVRDSWLLETTAYDAVASRARRCRDCLLPWVTARDYLRRTKQRPASERHLGADTIRTALCRVCQRSACERSGV